jgi:hypothetical protein
MVGAFFPKICLDGIFSFTYIVFARSSAFSIGRSAKTV